MSSNTFVGGNILPFVFPLLFARNPIVGEEKDACGNLQRRVRRHYVKIRSIHVEVDDKGDVLFPVAAVERPDDAPKLFVGSVELTDGGRSALFGQQIPLRCRDIAYYISRNVAWRAI